MKGKSFSRNYMPRREDREAMPLEKLLERRRSSLEHWVRENGVYSISQAEEKAKTQGLMITYTTLTKLEQIFEPKPAEKPVAVSTPVVSPPEEPKKRKRESTSETTEAAPKSSET
jgi:hypothetical protein